MRPWSLVRATALSLLFLACDEIIAPTSVDKMHFSIASGDNQAGNPGALLPLSLKVLVVDDRGRRVKNVNMNFQVASGGGSMLTGSTRTDADGVAEDRWTVGMSGTQRVEVSAVGGPPGSSLLVATFNATLTDVVAPTVTIDQAAGQADPTGASPIAFTVVFSESVTGFDAADVTFTGSTAGGTLAAAVSGSGANYSVSVTGMASAGTVVASVRTAAAQDAASNPSTASTSTDNTVTFTQPSVTINQAAGQSDPTTAGPIAFTVVFSQPVTGFDASDVSLAGSTAGGTLAASVSGSGANYTVQVTGMTSSGQVVASIPAGAASGAGGQPSTASTSSDNSVTFSLAVLSVTINQAGSQPDPTNASPILYSVVFSEPVTGFDALDVSFAGSTLGGLAASVTGSGANYTVSVTGMNGAGTVVASIPAAGAQNGVGTPNLASTSTDNTITFNNVRPTVTVDQSGGQADPTNTGPIAFAVVFSEPVTGFTSDDVNLSGSTAGGSLAASVSGSGSSYTVSVTGMTTPGLVVASIGAGAAVAVSGNSNLASTSSDNTVTFDNASPTVTINQAGGQADPTGASPIEFSVVFSEAVTGFTGADIDFTGSTTGGTLAAGVSGSGASYTVSVTGMASPGTVVASVVAGGATDLAGNLSGASTSSDNTVTFDTPPTVTINQAGGQADPTNGSPISFSVVFSASVTGFDGSDVSFTGSTVGGSPAASVTGSGSTYTVGVTGMTGAGAVVASIPAGAAQNANGLQSLASTSSDNTVTFDGIQPTVTINQDGGQTDPTTTGPITFAVVFSESVTGFSGSDISFTGSTVGGSPSASVSGSGASYSVSVTGMTGNGDVVASVSAGAAVDAAQNSSLASTSNDNTVTFSSPPSVTINQGAAQLDPTNATPITFDVVFSAAVTGFDGSDVSLTGSAGGSLVPSVTGSGATYTVSVTGMTSGGTVVASIAAGAAQTAGGSLSLASTSSDNSVTFDNTKPTVTVNKKASQLDPANFPPVLFTVVFSEAVTGFDASDVSFTGSTVGGAPVATVTGSGTTYEVSVSGMTIKGNIIVSLPADAAADLAGNTSNASTSTDNIVDWNPRYKVSGTVTGLTGDGLELSLNGTPTFLSSGTTSFTLNGSVLHGAPYLVSVSTQPTGQTCTITNASGTMGYANVTNVIVTCVDNNPAPTLTAIAPAAGNLLQTLDVVFTGTGFITGVSTVDVGADITVNTTTVDSPTQITANITITGAATTGARSFTVTNAGPGGGTSADQAFTVNP